jgi:rhomboid protease GluP
VTFIFACILFVLYIATLIAYAASSKIWLCTLYHFGAEYTYAIARKGHVHRLFLPLLLHGSFVHILSNVVFLFQIGFLVEKECVKWYRYIAFIILGGVGGNIISGTILAYSVSIGASTSLFTLLAAPLLILYRYWSNLGPMKFYFATRFALIMIFEVLYTFLSPYDGINHWAHVGGFVYGIFLAPIIIPLRENIEYTPEQRTQSE